MRRFLIALTLGALAVGAIGVPASAATTRMVAKDGKASPGNCAGNGTAYTTIQAAVKAANPGDTILVCPGTYREQVTINGSKDGLTLRAAPRYGATILSPSDLVMQDDATSLVLIRERADRVTVEGFRLKHPAPEPIVDTAGVGPIPDCGLLFGIRVDGTRAKIRFNTVRATGEWTLSDCGMGYGIGTGYADGGTSTVTNNVVRDSILAGIAAGGDGTRMTASRNIVRFYHLEAESVGRASLSRRTPFGRMPRASIAGGSADFVLGGVVIFFGAGGKLIENTAESGPTAGPLSDNDRPHLGVGVGAFLTDQKVTIRGNRAYRAFIGILAGMDPFLAGNTDPGLPEAVVEDNLAVQSVYGLYIQTADGTIAGNRGNSNIYGLTLAPDSSGNVVTENRAAANYNLDCWDETGSDLGSIDNTWTDNLGDSDQPDGICEPLQIR